MTGDPLDRIEAQARISPAALANEDVLALVEVARAARKAWDADERSAGAWTSTGEKAVRDLAAALDEIGSALARLDGGPE